MRRYGYILMLLHVGILHAQEPSSQPTSQPEAASSLPAEMLLTEEEAEPPPRGYEMTEEQSDGTKEIIRYSALAAFTGVLSASLALSPPENFPSLAGLYLTSAGAATSHLAASSLVLSSAVLRYNHTKKVRTLYGAALVSSVVSLSSLLFVGVAVAQSFVDEPSRNASALGGAFFAVPSTVQTTLLLGGYAIRESINKRREAPLNARGAVGEVCAFCVSSLREQRSATPLYALSGVAAATTAVSSVIALSAFHNSLNRFDNNNERAELASITAIFSSSAALTSAAMARYRQTHKLTTLYAFTGAAVLKLVGGSLLAGALVADDDPRGNPFFASFSESMIASFMINSLIPYKAIKNSLRDTTRRPLRRSAVEVSEE